MSLAAGVDPSAAASAEAAFHERIARAREDVGAWLGLGQCARARGDRRLALSYFQAGILAAPGDPWSWFEAAGELRELGRVGEAEAAYTSGLAVAPKNIAGFTGLGLCARLRGDHRAARAYFQRAALLEPENPRLLLEVAHDLTALGQGEEAEAQCRRALELAPEDVGIYLTLGQRARAGGDRAAALGYFAAGARAAPESYWALFEAAGELRHFGRLEEAAAAYTQGLTLAPENVQGWLGLGYCARARGERAAALAHFRRAAEGAAPGDFWPRLELAEEIREAGDCEAARELARQVLKVQPGQVQALLSLARIERQAGRHEDALAALLQAREAAPEEPGIWVELAVAERFLGRQAACDDYIAQALAMDPENAAALGCLAEQAMMAMNPALAFEIYQRAAVSHPEEISLRIGAVDALAALGETDKALAAAEELEAAYGPLPIIQAKRIYLMRLAGDFQGALALARAACAAEPDYFWIWTERFQVELLIGSDAGVEACLAGIRAGTAHEKAILEGAFGSYAERRWDLRAAAAHYEAAAGLNPEDAAVQLSLTRVWTLQFDLARAAAHLRKFSALSAHITKLQNKSLNISQTHYGQILDDYRLDQEFVERLVALQPLPPQARIAPLLGAVRENPDNTAVATGLMVALRQAGVFARWAAAAGAQVPRQIMQFWDSEGIPGDVGKLMQSWREKNPGYAVQVFNDVTARDYLSARYPAAVLAAYRRANNAAQKADIFRLAWLALEGGVYTDADNRCLKPVDGLVPEGVQLVLYQEDLGTLGNDFIAAVPGHPVIDRALKLAVNAINRGDTDNVWLATGPGLITRAFAQGLAEGAGLPAGVVVLARQELFQAVARNCALAYKTTSKDWLNAAFSRQRKRQEA
jgi:Flp pilus assembly protein TadD